MSETPRNRKNVRKGSRVEGECRSLFKDLGFPGSRSVPLSGALCWLHPDLAGDIKAGFTIAGREVTLQCKARRQGFAELHKWLADPSIDLLYLRRDNASPLICMDFKTFAYFLALVPAEDRLPPITDRLADLKRVAATSEYAATTLKRLEEYRKVGKTDDGEEQSCVDAEIPSSPSDSPPF